MQMHDVRAAITGGASGLGAATARAFRAAGAQVAILDRDAARGAALAAEIGASFHPVDVTDEASVDAALEAAGTAMGGLNALVTCAGIVIGARVVGREGPHPLPAFRQVIDVNLTGSFNCIRLAAARMAGNAPDADGGRGVIVTTASVAAFDGQKGQAAYAASKAGIAGMTLPLARELAGLGIRICAIAPGIFQTPMMDSLPPEVQAGLAADVPFPRRLGNPAEFAATARFLVECSYMNGEVIRLDGALRMR